MKKLYLVVQIIERGLGSDSKLFRVYDSKHRADFVANRIYGYVKEIDFVEGDDYEL